MNTALGRSVDWLQTMPKIEAPPAPPPRLRQAELFRLQLNLAYPSLRTLRAIERKAYADLLNWIAQRGVDAYEGMIEDVERDTMAAGVYVDLCDRAVKDFDDTELASRIWDYIYALRDLDRAEKAELNEAIGGRRGDETRGLQE